MHNDIQNSRAKVSRRRALGMGGTIGFGALLAACSSPSTDSETSTPSASDGSSLQPSTQSGDDLVAKLDSVRGVCGTETAEVTQGPYYFDVDSIRSDIREDRPGTLLNVAFRVQDTTCTPIPNSVVEIWHCDAGGIYSGFESSSMGGGGGQPDGEGGGGQGGGPGGTPPSGNPGDNQGGGPGADQGGPGGDQGGDQSGSGEVSDGSYSSGVSEADKQDDGTYLRGAQVADSNGIVQFTTIWPGWYVSRTVHIHLKVHIDKKNVLTAQVGFDDALNDQVFTTSPYDEHTGRDTYNGGTAGTGDDSIITSSDQLLTIEQTADGYLGYINLEVDV